MIIPRLVLALAFCATPVLAQDTSSPSSSASSSSAATWEVAPSSEPSASSDLSSSAPASPAALTDGELEMAVRAAYTAASAFALAHGNYFVRDGVFTPLHDAVAAATTAAYPTAVVPADAAADLDAAKVCLGAPGTELRIATNTYGDGITLVAVTDRRLFAYDYDPHQAAEIKVVATADCIKPN
jgi:hypothetical protein